MEEEKSPDFLILKHIGCLSLSQRQSAYDGFVTVRQVIFAYVPNLIFHAMHGTVPQGQCVDIGRT